MFLACTESQQAAILPDLTTRSIRARGCSLQVNLDPALRTETPLDLKIKSCMLVDLLNVVGMVVPPPPASCTAEVRTAAFCASAELGSIDAPTTIATACTTTSSLSAAPDGISISDVSDDVSPTADATKHLSDAAFGSRSTVADAADASATTSADAAIDAVAGRTAAVGALQPLSQASLDKWCLDMVNAEYARSKSGSWRRLLPSAHSHEYACFLDPLHSFNSLPFEV